MHPRPQVHLRRLQANSKLLLCGYQPNCKNGESCSHAHGEQELKSWRSQLWSAVRPYRKDFNRLGLCRTTNELASSNNCRKVLDCEYAHSQRELDHWTKTRWDNLYGTMRKYLPEHHQLKLCGSLKTRQYCRKELDCMYAHSLEELEYWEEHIECRKSTKKVLEMCRHKPACKFEEECRYAHNIKELQTWREGIAHSYLVS